MKIEFAALKVLGTILLFPCLSITSHTSRLFAEPADPPTAIRDVARTCDHSSPCSNTNNGLSQKTAKKGISAAISMCPATRCEMYIEGNRTISQTVIVGSDSQIVVLHLGNSTFSGTANPLFLLHPGSVIVTVAGTLIHQTAPSGNAIVCGGAKSGAISSGGIEGSGRIEVDGTGAGLVLGGSSDPGNLTSNICNYMHIGPITISAPNGIGEKLGNNGFLIHHEGTVVLAQQAFDAPSGLNSTTGEGITFSGGILSAELGATSVSASCIYENSSISMKLYGTSVDDCGVTVDGSGTRFQAYGVHFETPSIATDTAYLTFGNNANGSVITIYGGQIQEDVASSRSTFLQDETAVPSAMNWLSVRDTIVQEPPETVAEFFNSSGTGQDDIDFDNVRIPENVTEPIAGTGPNRFAISNVGKPTISSGFGTGASNWVSTNGAASFQIVVGSGATASSGVLNMPFSYTRGWICDARDISNPASSLTRESANTVGTVTLTNYNNAGTVAPWGAGDVLLVTCQPG